MLRRRPKRRDQVSPRELMRRAAWQLVGHRDFDKAWHRDETFNRNAELDALIAPLAELAKLAKPGAADDFLKQNFLEIQRFIDDLAHREAVAPTRDHDGLEAGLSALARNRTWTYKGFGTQVRAGSAAKTR